MAAIFQTTFSRAFSSMKKNSSKEGAWLACEGKEGDISIFQTTFSRAFSSMKIVVF